MSKNKASKDLDNISKKKIKTVEVRSTPLDTAITQSSPPSSLLLPLNHLPPFTHIGGLVKSKTTRCTRQSRARCSHDTLRP